MYKVLVTGANGFIGRALCRKLIDNNWHVRACIRNAHNKDKLIEGMDTIVVSSIESDSDWSKALEDVEIVVHLAAKVHSTKRTNSDSFKTFSYVNTAWTERLAMISAEKGVKRFVYLSSVKACGDGKEEPYSEKDTPKPSTPYGISKFEAELQLKKIGSRTGMDVVILRPPLVYGPGLKANFLSLFRVVNCGVPFPLASIRNRRSFIYLDDLLDAVVICMVSPNAAGKIFMVSGGEDVSTPELIRKVAEALRKKTVLFPFPVFLIKLIGKILGRSITTARFTDSLSVDSSRIRRELGWEPLFTLERGLSETAEWYLKS